MEGNSGLGMSLRLTREGMDQVMARIAPNVIRDIGWIVTMGNSDKTKLRKAGMYDVHVAAACILDMPGWEATCIVCGYEGKVKTPANLRWGLWRYKSNVANITWQRERPDPAAMWLDCNYDVYPGIWERGDK